jgi:GAF domain-containing protein
MQHHTPVVIPDILVDSRISIELYQSTFIKSLAIIPIHTVAPIGAIGVYWASAYSPTPEEINLLQTLADAAAIAIQNLRLYEELEQRVQERTTQLQQSLAFEALLKRIIDRVRDSLDEHQILQTVVTELAQGLSLECCDAGIYNAERTTSTIICEFNRSPKAALGQTFAIPQDGYHEIYQSLFRGEIYQFCPLLPTAMRSEPHSLSILTCPIQDDQDVLGDLWLFKPLEVAFNEQEVRLVQQVSN